MSATPFGVPAGPPAAKTSPGKYRAASTNAPAPTMPRKKSRRLLAARFSFREIFSTAITRPSVFSAISRLSSYRHFEFLQLPASGTKHSLADLGVPGHLAWYEL